MLGEQPVEVLELSTPLRGGCVQLDLVSRVQQLAPRARGEPGVLGPLYAEREDAPPGGLAARGAREEKPASAGQLPRIICRIANGPACAVNAADRPASSRKEVIAARGVRWVIGGLAIAVRGEPRRRAGACAVAPSAQSLSQASGAVCNRDDAGGTAATHHVSGASDQRAQLAGARGSLASPRVKASRGPPAHVGATGEREHPGVVAGAAMLDRSARDISGRGAACALQAFLPLLLVASVLQRGVKRAHALQGRAADRHVGTPGKARVGVHRAEVKRGDWYAVVSAGAQGATLQ